MFSRKKVFVLLISVIAVAMLLMVGATSALAADKIVWKSSSFGPASNYSQIHHDKACEAITLASGGRMEVKAFVGGSVVPETKELDAVIEGVLDLCYTCPMYNLDIWSAAGLISSRPGGLPGQILTQWFDYGGGWEMMNKMMEGYDVMVLPGFLSPEPGEVFLHSKRKIETVDDLKGLKVRTSGDGGEILARMGASPIFLPGGELYEAMQRGTIDAFEYAGLSTNWSMHFNEIADYVIISPVRAPSDPHVWFVNKKSWEALPDDLKVLVQNVLTRWTQEQQNFESHNDLDAIQYFRDAGCEVYDLPKEVENALSKEAQAFYAEKTAKESPIFGEILESMNAYGHKAGLW